MSYLIGPRGHKHFDESACQGCGLGFVENSPSDRAHHQYVHDQAVNGLKGHRPPDRHCIAVGKGYEIFVTEGISLGCDVGTLEEAARLARYIDTPSWFGLIDSFDVESGAVSVVWVRSKTGRIVGLLLLDHRLDSGWRIRRSGILRCLTGEALQREHFSVIAPPKIGVAFAWVLRTHRKQRLAQSMIQAAIALYGERFDTIGFQFPFTPAGGAALYEIAGRHGCDDVCVYGH
jgi:hypothetical protein